MKRGRPHVVYLSRQAYDLLVALKMCAGGRPYLLAGRYSINKPLSNAAQRCYHHDSKSCTVAGEVAEHFTVHGMRRTASAYYMRLGIHQTG
jgi:integrase